jgi:hypothetical protein
MLNEAHEDFGQFLAKRKPGLRNVLKILYDVGSIIGLLGMAFVLAFTGWTAMQLVYPFFGGVPNRGVEGSTSLAKRSSSPSSTESNDTMLRPIVSILQTFAPPSLSIFARSLG